MTASVGNPKLVLVTFYGFEALGVRALHAFLQERGCDVTVLFYKDRAMNEMAPLTDRDIQEIVGKVKEIGADIVGLSLFSAMYADGVRLAERLHQELGALVVWGGYHATVAPEECIVAADVVCVGEGEYPLWELYERLASGQGYEDIANLWVRSGDRITHNQARPLIQDLDSLPFFDYSDRGKYYYDEGQWHAGEPFRMAGGRGGFFQAHYLIQTSRGCPFACTYCSNSIFREITKGKGNYVRQRSVPSVMAQLAYARRAFPNLKRVFFYDEVLVIDRRWLREFAAAYKAQVRLPFSCNLHPNSVDEETIRLLVDAGLDDVKVGIESGSERVRRDVFHRFVSTAKMRETVHVLHQSGLTPCYNLIVDNPYETADDKDASFAFLLGIPRPYDLRLFSLTYLPGTALTRRALADGLITEAQIEGRSRKTLERWEVSLSSQAPDREALFWNSVISLLPKQFIPKRAIKYIYESPFFRRYPGIVAAIASVANAIKKGTGALRWLREGRIDWAYIRRQWHSSIRVAR